MAVDAPALTEAGVCRMLGAAVFAFTCLIVSYAMEEARYCAPKPEYEGVHHGPKFTANKTG